LDDALTLTSHPDIHRVTGHAHEESDLIYPDSERTRRFDALFGDAATGLTKTEQSGGSALYTGTIPNTTADPANDPADDALIRMITNLRTGIEPGAPRGFSQPESHTDLHLEMTVASDGLVRRLSVTFLRLDADSAVKARPTTWTVTYSRLGGTPPVTAPPASAPGTPVIVIPSVAPSGPHGG
jgi:hypothetical protein